jgi:hypothetical protein
MTSFYLPHSLLPLSNRLLTDYGMDYARNLDKDWLLYGLSPPENLLKQPRH